MCALVGVPLPPDDEALDLVLRCEAYVMSRVRSGFPGAEAAIRSLRSKGYLLHTASGEESASLRLYLEGMGVCQCFGRLYGPDLVRIWKGGPEFYARVFADAGISPGDALVVDDSPAAMEWATATGARGVLVATAPGTPTSAVLTIGTLAELPEALGRVGRESTG